MDRKIVFEIILDQEKISYINVGIKMIWIPYIVSELIK